MKKQTIAQNVFAFGLFLLFFVLATQNASAILEADITVSEDRVFEEGTAKVITITAEEDLDNVTANFTSLPMSTLSTNKRVATFNWTPDFDEVTTGASRTETVTFTIDPSTGDNITIERVLTINNKDVLTANAFVITTERSDPDNQTDTKSAQLNLTNIHPDTLTGLDATKSASDVNIREVMLVADNVANGGTVTLNVSIYVPADLDSIDSNYDIIEHDFGDVTIPTSFGNVIIPVLVRPNNELIVKDLVADLPKTSRSVSDLEDAGEEVKNVKPGETIIFNITVENTYEDSTDPDIEKLDLDIAFSSSSDIDEYDNDGLNDERLPDGDEADGKLEIELEYDADGTFEVEFLVKGTDENGAVHGLRHSVDVEVDQKRHELFIDSARLSPETVTCELETSLSLAVFNLGRNDEEDVRITLSAPALSLNEEYDNISIDSTERDTRTVTIPVPQNLATGTHRITIKTFYDDTAASDQSVISLKKAACVAPVAPEPAAATPPVVTNTPPVVVDADTEAESEDEGIPLWLIIIGYIVVLGVGVFVVVLLIKKKA